MKEENKPEFSDKKCSTCQGYGWHPMGGLSPIGRIDANEWKRHVIKCPWCGKGSVDEGKRYEALIKTKEREDG